MTAPSGKKCPNRAVRAEVLEELIWDTVSELLCDPVTLDNELRRRQAETTTDYGIVDKCRKLEAEIERLATQENRFLDLYGDGSFDRGVLDRKIEQVNAQKRRAESEMSTLEHQSRETDNNSLSTTNLETFCQTIGSGLEKMTFEERQKLLRLVIDRAIISSKKQFASRLRFLSFLQTRFSGCVRHVLTRFHQAKDKHPG